MQPLSGMRSIVFAVVVSLAACAHAPTNRPVNVHSVKVEIKSQIDDGRAIVSMGKVTRDSAEVYTERPGAPRRAETWVRVDGAWKLQDTRDLLSAQ